MEDRSSRITLPGGQTLNLRISDISEEIGLNDLISIDMSNIPAELVTISVLLNNFGIILADINHKVSIKKLDLEIMEAKIKNEIRNGIIKSQVSSSSDEEDDDEEFDDTPVKKKIIPTKKLSNDEVDTLLVLDNRYQTFKKLLLTAQKEQEYISSTYWSIKEKSSKLDKISTGLVIGDVLDQLVQTKLKKINLVSLKAVKSRIE